MSAPQFTPGPWYATQADDRFPVRIREESSDAVLATGDDGGHPDPEFAIPDDVIMANARLIASAPELYEALESIIAFKSDPYCKDSNPLQCCRHARKVAAAALAKARGEAA